MLFDKLFKRKSKADNKADDSVLNSVSAGNTNSAPAVAYVHTAANREKVSVSENDVLVLWWISKKKKGYERAKNSFPKWFDSQYGIDFNRVLANGVDQGMLSDTDGIIKITDSGESRMRELDYVIYIHEHPRYCLSISDFKNAKNLHQVQNADLVWGVFNLRILTYTKNQMWKSLTANYANMADLLVEEKKYEQAVDYVFAVAYLCTSGMQDNNELTPIMSELTKSGWKNKYLPNGMPDIFLLEINNYYVTVPFGKIQNNLNLDWTVIQQKYLESPLIANLEGNLPFRYFEKEQSFELFKQAIEADGKKGIFPLKDCTKKLKWNTPDEHSRKYFYASVENKVNARR